MTRLMIPHVEDFPPPVTGWRKDTMGGFTREEDVSFLSFN